jgi:hypothetical protein
MKSGSFAPSFFDGSFVKCYMRTCTRMAQNNDLLLDERRVQTIQPAAGVNTYSLHGCTWRSLFQ